jgi:ribonucleoside-diphosphate reductase alpha chain
MAPPIDGEEPRKGNRTMDIKRPVVLPSITFKVISPQGTIFTTISELDNVPFEVFVNVGKGGSEVCAEAESIGRLISLLLRSNMEKPTIERLRWVAGQLINVGSKESIGFGPNRVSSIPDGIAKTLVAYLDYKAQQVAIEQENALFASEFNTPLPLPR